MKKAFFEREGTIELNTGDMLTLNVEINVQNTKEDKIIYLPKLQKICEQTLKGLITALINEED